MLLGIQFDKEAINQDREYKGNNAFGRRHHDLSCKQFGEGLI